MAGRRGQARLAQRPPGPAVSRTLPPMRRLVLLLLLLTVTPVASAQGRGRGRGSGPDLRQMTEPTPAPRREGPVPQQTVGNGTPASCTEAALSAAVAGTGVITFRCGPTPVTIELSAPLVFKRWDTTIQGEGRVTLSGRGATRVLRVFPEASVELSGLTITRGAADVDGAGLRNDGGTVVLRKVTFSRNVAGGAAGGGAISNASGRVTIEDGAFTGNSSACHGGAIVNQGPTGVASLRLVRTTFSDNRTQLACHGGAIYNVGQTESAVVTIEDSTFSGNAASGGDGGAIYSRGGTVTIAGSTFTGNAAENAGAFYNVVGIATVTRSLFTGNRSVAAAGQGRGGAILNGGLGSFGESALTIVNSTFWGNSAGQGAALCNVSVNGTAAVSVAHSTLGGGKGDHKSVVANTVFGGNGTVYLKGSVVTGGCSGKIADGGSNMQFPGTSCVGVTRDPRLDPSGPQDHGGPTRTVALLPGSPAVDGAGPEGCLSAPVSGLDQRGYARKAPCDVGAFEAGALPVKAEQAPVAKK